MKSFKPIAKVSYRKQMVYLMKPCQMDLIIVRVAHLHKASNCVFNL